MDEATNIFFQSISAQITSLLDQQKGMKADYKELNSKIEVIKITLAEMNGASSHTRWLFPIILTFIMSIVIPVLGWVFKTQMHHNDQINQINNDLKDHAKQINSNNHSIDYIMKQMTNAPKTPQHF